jgi:hypothetical protein
VENLRIVSEPLLYRASLNLRSRFLEAFAAFVARIDFVETLRPLLACRYCYDRNLRRHDDDDNNTHMRMRSASIRDTLHAVSPDTTQPNPAHAPGRATDITQTRAAVRE